MDWLDRISIIAITCLLTAAVVVTFLHRSNDAPDKTQKKASRTQITAPQFSKDDIREKKIRSLIESQNLEQAERLVMKLIRQYPDEGEPYMLMGDIYLRKQHVMKALYKYRYAVDRNPDYLDKNTRLFQGKKLKNVVLEGLSELKKRGGNGNDEKIGKDRKLIYYLQRRIAGACG